MFDESTSLHDCFLNDAEASWNCFGASQRRLGRGLEACWGVGEASWGVFRTSWRFLRASSRFSCGVEACWKWLGGSLEASWKHFGSVLGRPQRGFSGLEGDMIDIGQF